MSKMQIFRDSLNRKIEMKDPFSFATVAEVDTSKGVRLKFDGAENESVKFYPIAAGITIAAGDRVRVFKDSGTYVVEYKLTIPSGGGTGGGDDPGTDDPPVQEMITFIIRGYDNLGSGTTYTEYTYTCPKTYTLRQFLLSEYNTDGWAPQGTSASTSFVNKRLVLGTKGTKAAAYAYSNILLTYAQPDRYL